jgi:transposase
MMSETPIGNHSGCSGIIVSGIDARDLDQIRQAIEKAKKRFKLDGEVKILSCYEPGRDGFWLHQYLLSCGIDYLVVDSSSIEVN